MSFEASQGSKIPLPLPSSQRTDRKAALRRAFSEAAVQTSGVGSSTQGDQSRDEQSASIIARRDINRAYLSGLVSARPFYGIARNGRRYAVVRIVTNSFGGQYDFRVRLSNTASLTYCREQVHEGLRVFVFGRLATLPRTASDGSQTFSGTLVASRISVEKSVDDDVVVDDLDAADETANNQK